MKINLQYTYLESIENHPGGHTELYSLLTLIVVFWLFLDLLRDGSYFIVIQSLYCHPPLANTFSEIISDLLFDFSSPRKKSYFMMIDSTTAGNILIIQSSSAH